MAGTHSQSKVSPVHLLRTPPTAFSFTPICNPQKLSVPNSKYSSHFWTLSLTTPTEPPPQPTRGSRAPTSQSLYQHSSLSIPISSLLPITICSLSPSHLRTVLSKKLEPIKLENQGTKGENKSIKPINRNPISDNTTQPIYPQIS